MSKKKKSEAKEKRKKEKRARKSAQKARYQTYKDSGNNQKSKRNRIASKKSGRKTAVRTHSSNCGNAGCQRCHPISFKSFLKNGSPSGMPHWMYKKWIAAGNKVPEKSVSFSNREIQTA